ncbi:MAG: molybdopterin converting factor subunit 1 [Planctomycetes bacterium]|nr:molybdopterin converting factor subunit 1 [Planctomycetota bacterium]
MKTRILLFAALAEKTGVKETAIELPDGATVRDALAALEAAHPAVGEMGKGLSMAVNMAYVGRAHVLRDGDELALIPPVSGG